MADTDNSCKDDSVINVGDTVSLLPTATSDEGTILSSWVKKEKWIVEEVNGESLLLNSNDKGEHNINTSIHKKNAVKVVE